MVWACGTRSLTLRLFRLSFWRFLDRSGLFLLVLLLFYGLFIRWLILLVQRAFTRHYRMMRLFRNSLWQNNYSTAFSRNVSYSSNNWSWCFHAGLFWSWAFLLLGVLRGNSWAVARWRFARFLRYTHTCWLFLNFRSCSWRFRLACLFGWWFWLTFLASCR